jgi:hypothetical protein
MLSGPQTQRSCPTLIGSGPSRHSERRAIPRGGSAARTPIATASILALVAVLAGCGSGVVTKTVTEAATKPGPPRRSSSGGATSESSNSTTAAPTIASAPVGDRMSCASQGFSNVETSAPHGDCFLAEGALAAVAQGLMRTGHIPARISVQRDGPGSTPAQYSCKIVSPAEEVACSDPTETETFLVSVVKSAESPTSSSATATHQAPTTTTTAPVASGPVLHNCGNALLTENTTTTCAQATAIQLAFYDSAPHYGATASFTMKDSAGGTIVVACNLISTSAGCTALNGQLSVAFPLTESNASPGSAAQLGNQCIPDPDYGPPEPSYAGAHCPHGQVTRVQAAFGQGCISDADNPAAGGWDPNSCSPPVSTYGLPCEDVAPIIGLPSYDHDWSPACYVPEQTSGGS